MAASAYTRADFDDLRHTMGRTDDPLGRAMNNLAVTAKVHAIRVAPPPKPDGDRPPPAEEPPIRRRMRLVNILRREPR